MKAVYLLVLLNLLATNAWAQQADELVHNLDLKIQLYGGTSLDVSSYSDVALKSAIKNRCGSLEKFVKIRKHQLLIDLVAANFDHTDHRSEYLEVDMRGGEYNGIYFPLVTSMEYPGGRLKAEIVCKR